MPLERGSVPQIVNIRGKFEHHACTGILVAQTFILTSAYCVEEVGPNALVVVSPNGMYEGRRTTSVNVGFQNFMPTRLEC